MYLPIVCLLAKILTRKLQCSSRGRAPTIAAVINGKTFVFGLSSRFLIATQPIHFAVTTREQHTCRRNVGPSSRCQRPPYMCKSKCGFQKVSCVCSPGRQSSAIVQRCRGEGSLTTAALLYLGRLDSLAYRCPRMVSENIAYGGYSWELTL